MHDLGTNFNSATFRNYFKSISSTLKQMLIKAYHSVGLVKRYYVLVRRAFKIVTKELLKALKEDRLQIAIKAINDTAGPNSLVLILFVFKTLPRLTEQDRLAAFTQERIVAINKAIRKVRKCYAAKQLLKELQVLKIKAEKEVEEKKYDLNISTVLDEKESDSYVLFTKDSEVLITDKERRDYKLLAKLRVKRIIKSFEAPFQESKAKELARLIA
ncbi:hypothetical protein MBM_06897 [Drepanopeziza brunnea f. sp. 'multigermtubi' MB_m1]|uniref:Polyprotein n=1 Tax=Marssonina brunnea f. sp. multigermtubi (strain MB_m1) TaxID=1072389 RepID=K1WQB0_MARBU|nr:uncharacterized protein MBM_06897 [Drepanopeziza brunnea f. sp. 'multigermtubi' MB_m1]EKD15136.1 hypothetical protein MBM_06897 [Drepanopeziza brunnea f. sp. 'multigermtubi' MB_m1]